MITLLGSVSEETAAEARNRFDAGRSLRDLPLPLWAPPRAKWGVRRYYAERPGEDDRIRLVVRWFHAGVRVHTAVAEWKPAQRGGKREWTVAANPPAELQRKLLVFVSAHPGAKLVEIADALGLSNKGAARRLVDRSLKTGSLRRDERGVLLATVPYLEIRASA